MWPFGPRNEYPYTDFHELNMDWILRKIIELDYKVKNWLNEVVPTIRDTVNTWLDDHPEATTTVEDGAITESKINDSFLLEILNDYVTPQMFGALADGSTNDINAMQAAIDSGKSVYLPDGTYLIGGTLTLRNNLNIIGQSTDSIIKVYRNSENRPLSISGGEIGTSTFTQYNGYHDIILSNFTFDMNDSDMTSGGNIGLSHNKNVILHKINFINAYNEHYVDIAGCNNISFMKCTADCSHYFNYGTDIFNIDWAWKTGFPHFGAWDNTPNTNISFDDCVFNDSSDTFVIGTHAAPANAIDHKNITIKNNVFNTCSKLINAAYWKTLKINNNIINTCGTTGYYPIYLFNTGNIMFSNNMVNNSGYHLFNAVSNNKGDYECAIISNNILNDCVDSVFRFNKFTRATISNNTFENCGYFTELVNSDKINIFDNNADTTPLIDNDSTNITCCSNNEINQTFEMVENDTAQLNNEIMTSKLILIEATRYHHVGSCLLSPSRMINNAVAIYKASPSGGDVILDITGTGLVTLTTGHASVATYITFKKIL